MKNEDRYQQLDGLRGSAAVAVMIYHYCWVYSTEFHAFYFPLPVLEYGFYGVELFFIISGFVIFYTINKKQSVGNFIANRFIRLFPTYWLCIVLTFATVSFYSLSTYRNTTAFDLFANMTMLNGVFLIKYVDPSYWSLQIELFFYFTMAVMLYFKQLKHIDFILWGWLVLIVIYNVAQKLPGLGLVMNLQFGSLFIAGISFFRIRTLAGARLNNYLLLAASYGCSLIAIKYHGAFLGITLVYLIFSLALFTGNNFLSGRLFTFLGGISYALYLVHQNIGITILRQFQLQGYTSRYLVLVPMIFSILLAWGITVYFERPVMKWLKKSYEKIFKKSHLA